MPRRSTPGELLLGTPGYTFGLGFAVRQGAGVAGVPGSAGEFMWAGYAGTYFWVDPKEELVAVYMSQAPSPSARLLSQARQAASLRSHRELSDGGRENRLAARRARRAISYLGGEGISADQGRAASPSLR